MDRPKRERGLSVQERMLQSAVQDGILLAHTYEKEKPPPDPKGWWISEKLDGVRAYWNGQALFTRSGNKLSAPPWFVEGLPQGSNHLDGELWLGRGAFEACVSIVRAHDPRRAEEWRQLRFVVFDSPVVGGQIDLPYEERHAHSERVLQAAPYAEPVAIYQCEDEAHLATELAAALARGGEGLMLREAGSLYERTRSHSLLKVKSFDDAEARVIGHSRDSKLEGALGALVCEMPLTGVQFKVGSGLAMSDRLNFKHAMSLWPVGTVISYKYQGLTDANSKPRFPVYLRRRDDKSWDDVVADAARGGDAGSPAPMAIEKEQPADPSAAASPARKKSPQNKALGVKKTLEKPPPKKAASGKAGGGAGFHARGVSESESGGKFWEVRVEPGSNAMVVTFGKLGAKGTAKTTPFSDGAAATKEAKKQAEQKASKGYAF